MSDASLYFVCDGPRESLSALALVRKEVPNAAIGKFKPWKEVRLNKGAGPRYGRKLRFAIKEARDGRAAGIVAILDSDREKPRARLKELDEARRDERQDPEHVPLPIAIGEAAPHAEAWLLDDEKAVRTALGLAIDIPVPSVSKCDDPKAQLNDLCDRCEGSNPELLGRIAEELDEARCNHAKDTGLKEFLADVRREFAATT